MRADLPTGTVTFLFTDVEGSTRRLDQLVDTEGDAFFAARIAEAGVRGLEGLGRVRARGRWPA